MGRKSMVGRNKIGGAPSLRFAALEAVKKILFLTYSTVLSCTIGPLIRKNH